MATRYSAIGQFGSRQSERLHSAIGQFGIGKLTQLLVDDAEQVCCEAKFVIAQWDTHTRKIIPPTPEWWRALGLDE